ncbi:MAG: bifunctional diguanylate cyclase/phosphodiesterase [Gammaproteobacteria bacterium]|nr:bifunctional diguanylate cyclase/phosphodiesterase [Gammaproteobacteria bacterium]
MATFVAEIGQQYALADVMGSLSHILRDARLRLRGAYVLVLVLGVLFSGLIFVYSEDVLNVSRRLIDAELPALNRIAALKVEIMREEAALYDFYATEDHERFEREFTDTQVHVSQLIDEIERQDAQPQLANVRADHAELGHYARDLVTALDSSHLGYAEAHDILAGASSVVREIHAELDVLARLVEGRVRDSAGLTGMTVRKMTHLGVLFSLGIFLIAVFVGHYIDVYVRESAERRKLAVFAERNPNPVMRLALNGDVIYANAAALELAQRMGWDSGQALLPLDAEQRLAVLRSAGERYEVWHYDRDDRALECGIHFLPDLSIFHAYVTDITDRRLSEEKLVHQAYHHPLTGLPNRRMFQEVVEQTLRAPDRGAQRSAVVLLDIDRLKVIIDTLGHEVGDELLKTVAAQLRAALEDSRVLCRGATLYHLEADSFAVFVPIIAGEQTVALLAEKIASACKQVYVDGREYSVSFSIGIANFPEDGNDALTLLKNADSAMHGVKRQGGGGFRLYKPEMNAMAAHWLNLESYLRHAIERNELRLFYQPQIDVRTGRIAGLEALLRWQHPQRGLLSPKEFITVAEDSGLINEIGEWALRTACAQNCSWRKQGTISTTVAVNISGRQFHQQNLVAMIGTLLADSGLPADALEIEITESVAMHDVERTAQTLRELKEMGVQLAIDDFGTGFSSLAYLKRFPIDKLKIDQSFIKNVTTDGTDAAIARAVVSLGHALRLRVCAEGVETRDQLARLRQFDCDEAQGVFYSQPVPPDQIELLSRGHKRLAGAGS